MKCPKCHTKNPDDSKYCKECATPLPSSEEVSAPTETLEVPKEELTTGSTSKCPVRVPNGSIGE